MKNPVIITGTIAKPSSPSVRFTAFEDPTIIKIPKGTKKPSEIEYDIFKEREH